MAGDNGSDIRPTTAIATVAVALAGRVASGE